jgi:hypothetical protein
MIKVAIAKPNAGQYLIFWGATGLASDIDSTMGGAEEPDAATDDMGAEPGIDGEAGDNTEAGVDGATPPTGAPDAAPPPLVVDASVDRGQTGGGIATAASAGCSLAPPPSNGAPTENNGALFLIVAAAMSARLPRNQRRDR